ncbi:hypothetical protein F183_A21070 [Bryobacterales bacterium F-183]|nr:hypothetical protein F183_A21070 [Bryobacterales bacterium F-183]
MHLAAVYLRYRAEAPELAARWIHEEEFKERRRNRSGKVPDAVLGMDGKIVEFGGAYKKKKLQGFHEYCQALGREYEVW